MASKTRASSKKSDKAAPKTNASKTSSSISQAKPSAARSASRPDTATPKNPAMMAPASNQPVGKKTKVTDGKNNVLPEKSGNAKLDEMNDSRRDPEGQMFVTDEGLGIIDTDNSLKAGVRGPSLIEDFHLREKITRFDHERIPERVVHARGAAAHGVFESYGEAADITRAGFLQGKGNQTPVFVRFSTVLGSRGSADTARDVRGFAVKFYTDEGNFDLVGNNIPVFFIQDGIKFPDLIHSGKPEAHHEMPQAATAHDTFWDFVSLTPESTHMLMWTLSDRGLPRSYANMEGFGVHTFRMINDAGKSRFVKFHWKPVKGLDSLVWDEAQKLAGKDPDFHRRGLWESIELGQGPEYELGVQIIEEKDADKFAFDLLDATKLVPEELVPVHMIGKLKLNRNPDNYFAETEQVAFCVSHLVPGIDVTNDPLMQARLFSYLDTQLTRLGGPNFAEIPINRPITPVHNNQQDGSKRHAINQGRANYSPNSIGGGCPFMAQAQGRGFVHTPEPVEGTKIRQRSETFADHFTQAKLFFDSLTDVEQKHLKDAACFELGKVEIEEIRERVLTNFAEVNREMAEEIAQKVGVTIPAKGTSKVVNVKLKGKTVTESPALSQTKPAKDPSNKGRLVAAVIADGFDLENLNALKSALTKQGARMEVVSTRLGAIKSAKGEGIKADKSFLTGDSSFYDAIFYPSGVKSAATLKDSSEAIYFAQTAYQHCKTIGAAGDASAVLENAGILGARVDSKRDQGDAITGIITDKTGAKSRAKNDQTIPDFLKAMESHRHWNRPEKLSMRLN